MTRLPPFSSLRLQLSPRCLLPFSPYLASRRTRPSKIACAFCASRNPSFNAVFLPFLEGLLLSMSSQGGFRGFPEPVQVSVLLFLSSPLLQHGFPSSVPPYSPLPRVLPPLSCHFRPLHPSFCSLPPSFFSVDLVRFPVSLLCILP